MKNNTKILTIKIIISWLLVILWAGVIFYLSGKCADDSQNQSRGLINTVTGVFGTVITDEEQMTNIDGIVRETSHGVEYFIFGALVFNAVFLYRTESKKKKNSYSSDSITQKSCRINDSIKISVIICILFEISDELHQIPIPGRAFELLDLSIDTVGACLGIICIYFIYKKMKAEK